MPRRFLRRLLPVLVLAALPAIASAGVYIGVSVDVPPPPLPVYVQPPCPAAGYLWTPGYWAWGPYGYYWVPGTWVLPPEAGLLWTPGYWGWVNGAYLWHGGYWGPRVGFYGGIDYGFGYDGVGFVGGFWRGGTFFYNRAVLRVGPAFRAHVYYRRSHYYHRFGHVSFNGGRGGVFARPTRWDLLAARERRFGPNALQRRHDDMALHDRALRADFNHGRPPIAATTRATRFQGRGVFAARAAGGPYRRRAPQQRMRGMRADRPTRRFGSRPEARFSHRSAQRFQPHRAAVRGRGRRPGPHRANHRPPHRANHEPRRDPGR